MGGNSSRSSSFSHNYEQQQCGYATPYHAHDNQYYPPPQQSYGAPSQLPPSGYGGHAHEPKKRLERRFSKIADEYRTLDQVTQALARAGLESSNLIVGIDFTKSNEWTGKKSFNNKSLHHISNAPNPYEQAISIIGKTLAAFDEDNLIPCFGFGDVKTHDEDVFSFYSGDRVCNGFEEVLSRYREIVPHLRLSGPTSFAPVIEMAMTIVEQSGGQYHVLLIIADGQVTRSSDTAPGTFSPQEQQTVDAIVDASKYPLSIVLVGVGDGPWDMMREFDDNIPARDFDNFQFVNFSEIMAKNAEQTRKETEFALSALMEIPDQYKATMELGLLGRRRGTCPQREALPPPSSVPAYSNTSSFYYSKPAKSMSDKPSSYPHHDNINHGGTAPPEPSSPHVTGSPAADSAYDNLMCPICFTNNKNMAFGCGHQTCSECGQDLETCPICRSEIQTRIKLY